MNHPYVAILFSCGLLLASGCDREIPQPFDTPTQEVLARMAAAQAEQRAHERKVEQLKADLPKLAALQGLRRAAKATPILTGKIVALTPWAEPELAGVWWQLPEELRAYSAAEAETVIRVEKSLKVVGEYQRSGAKAYMHVWTVQIIDAKTRTLVGSKVFLGDMPPQSIRGRSYSDLRSAAGSEPGSDVCAWILGLPRKASSTSADAESADASPASRVAAGR